MQIKLLIEDVDGNEFKCNFVQFSDEDGQVIQLISEDLDIICTIKCDRVESISIISQ